jgi:hypothetical protein
MGDYRNKLKRKVDDFNASLRSTRQRLRERLEAGEQFWCECRSAMWERGTFPRMWHIHFDGEPERFYCPICWPSWLSKQLKEQEMEMHGGWQEFPDAKQLALFAEGISRPTAKPPKRKR